MSTTNYAHTPKKVADYTFKIMTMGDGEVGKTNMVSKYVQGKFLGDHIMTIGVQFFTKLVEGIVGADGKSYNTNLQVWDLGGQDRWGTVRDNFYKGAVGGLLIYDITNRKSFDDLSKWIEEAQKNMGYKPIILVGNKVDLEEKRQVSTEEGQAFALGYGFGFAETSAKDGTNIEAVFQGIAESCLYNGLCVK